MCFVGQPSKEPTVNNGAASTQISSKTKTEKTSTKKDPPECEKMLNAMKDLGFPGGPGVLPYNTMNTKPNSGKKHAQTLPGTDKQSVDNLIDHGKQTVHGQMGIGKQSIDGLPNHNKQNGQPGTAKQSVSLSNHEEQNVQVHTGTVKRTAVGLPHEGQGRSESVKQTADGGRCSGKQNVHRLSSHGKEIGDQEEAASTDDAAKEFNRSPTGNPRNPMITVEIPQDGGSLADSGISEEKSPTSIVFKKKGLSAPSRSAVGNKKMARRLSRKLTGRMTQRQRQELMLEGEFDEFDVGMEEGKEIKDSDSIMSPPGSDDEGSVSDDTDHEFETEIATQLNIERIQVRS